MIVVPVAIAVFVPMLIEAGVSRRHENDLRARGAVEPPGDVYRVMQVAYPAAFLVLIGEGLWRAPASGALLAAGAAVFLAAKALKYSAIHALGVRWTFRVLVPPYAERIVSGPYRWLRHPNYVAVAGELAGTALMMRATVTGPVALLAFVTLMVLRVRVEERALHAFQRNAGTQGPQSR